MTMIAISQYLNYCYRDNEVHLGIRRVRSTYSLFELIHTHIARQKRHSRIQKIRFLRTAAHVITLRKGELTFFCSMLWCGLTVARKTLFARRAVVEGKKNMLNDTRIIENNRTSIETYWQHAMNDLAHVWHAIKFNYHANWINWQRLWFHYEVPATDCLFNHYRFRLLFLNLVMNHFHYHVIIFVAIHQNQPFFSSARDVSALWSVRLLYWTTFECLSTIASSIFNCVAAISTTNVELI